MDIIEKKRRSSFTPIVSYGIILYYIDAVTNKIYFLLLKKFVFTTIAMCFPSSSLQTK